MFTEILFKTILNKYIKKIKTFISLTCLPENAHKLLDTNFTIKTFNTNLVIQYLIKCLLGGKQGS